MVELAKVSSATKAELDNFRQNLSVPMAKELGVLNSEVINVTASISKLGYSLDEAQNLTRLSLLAKTVGDLNSVGDSVDYLVSIMKGFKVPLQDMSRVVDFLNYTANTTSIDFASLGEGFKRMSSAMSEANNTLAESAGLLTAGFDVTRNAEKTSTALVTTSMRLRGVSEDGEDLSNLIPTLEEKFNKFGLTLKKDEKTFKSTYEIFKDLNELFKSGKISDMEAADILESVAGKRQANVVASIIRNMETAIDVTNKFAISQGSALDEFRRYQEGIEYAYNNMRNSVTELNQKLLDSKTIIGAIKLGDWAIQNVTALGKFNIALAVLTLALGMVTLSSKKAIASMTQFQIVSQIGGIKKFSADLLLSIKALLGFKVATDSATISATALNIATGALLLGIPLIAQGIGYLISLEDRWKKKNEELINSIKMQKDIVLSTNDLIKERENLIKVTDKTIEQENRLKEINEQLVGIFPELNTYYDEKNKKLDVANKTINKLAESNEKLLLAESQLYIMRNKNNINKQISEYEQISKTIDEITEKINNSFKTGSPILEIKPIYNKDGIFTGYKEEEANLQEYNDKLQNLKTRQGELEESFNNYNMNVEISNKLNKDGTTIQTIVIKGLNDENKAIQENTNIIADNKDEIIDLLSIQKSFSTTLTKARKDLSDINSALKEYKENGKLSADTIIKLSQQYPQLLSLLNDEKALYNELIKIQDEKVVSVQNSLNDQLTSLKDNINDNLKLYNEDISNFTDAQKAKLFIASELGKKLLQINQLMLNAEYQNNPEAQYYWGRKLANLNTARANINKQIDEFFSLKSIDVRKLVTGTDTKPNSKSSTLKDTSHLEGIQELIRSYTNLNNVTETWLKNKQKELELAKNQKDYNAQLRITQDIMDKIANDLMPSYIAEQKAFHEEANKLREANKQFSTESWFDDSGEKTLAFIEQYNKSSKETQEEMDKLFNKLQALKKAYGQSGEEIVKLKEYTDNLSSNQIDLLFKISDQSFEDLKSQIDDLKFSFDMLGETEYANKLNNTFEQLSKVTNTANYTAIEIEALHKLYQSGQITLTEYNERYDILKTRFQNAAKEAKALKEQQLQLEFAQFDKMLEPLNAKLNIFKNTLSGLSDTSFDEKINVLSLMIGNAGTQTSELIDEFNRLSQEPFSDAVSKRLKEINAKISQNKMSTIEWQKQLNQTHITQFLSEIDKGMQKLDRQAEQMKHNIEMMQDGILTGTDMKTLAEYGLDLDVENVYNAEILALKRNEEDRLAIIEEYDKKELEAQDDTFDEYLAKIEEQDRIKQALIDEKRAEEFLQLQEYNAETITEIENFLVDLQSTYESGFDNIIEALEEKVSEIKSLIASANKAMDSLTPPKTSTPGFGSSTGARVVPKYAKESGDDNFVGGVAMVNDAKGNNYIEPIILPDGRMISFKERNVFVDLPKGTKIISAKDVPKFEDGNVSVTKSKFSMFSNDSTEFKIIEAWDSLIKKIEEQRDEAKQNIESLIEQRDAIGEGNDGYAELNEKIYEQVQIINKSNSQLKSFVKSKWDTVYKGFDTANKVYTDKADDVSELQKMNELYKNNDKYFEKAINYNAQQLDITKGLNDELTNQKNYLTDQLATLEKDSYEWGVVNGKIEAINEELEDVNYNIAQIEVEGLNLAFEGMLNGLKSINKEIENLDYQLSLQNIINPDDYNAVNAITNKIKNANAEQVNYLTNVLKQLQQQLSLLDSASGQWSIIAGQIANVEAQIKSNNLAIAQQAKGMFSKYLTGIQGSVQKSNPKPSKSDSNDDMVSGLEKELEVQKIINFARENELTISQKQLQILNSKGAIERDTLKTIQKQLELQQLQNKLENLKKNKTIQQLKKQDDGTWQYEYVVDEKAIYETEQAILDKKLELIKIEKDKQNKLSQEAQDAAASAFDDRMNKLNEVLKNAENRMYKSAEAFKQALLKLGLNLPIDEMVAEYEKYFITTGDILIKDAIQKTVTMLNQTTAAFKNAGNEAGASYTEGLIGSIDEIVKGEGSFIQKQGQIVHMLLNRAVDFALAGNEAGLSYIEGLIGSMGTDDYMPDLNDIAIKIKDKIVITAHFMRKDGQEAGAALLEGIATGIDNILANGSIQNKTQAVLDLLNQANQYGTLGQALGTEFMDGMMATFTNMASQITGDGEGVLSEAINAITQQLDTKIVEFAEKGDLQGIAYAEALRNKLVEALEDAELTQEDIIILLSQFKDFDLAGLLSGEAYEKAIGIGFEDAETTVGEKNSAIVEGLEEEVAKFGEAGTAQGEAYKNAITTAFEDAITKAKSIIGSLVDYINGQGFTISVGTNGLPNDIKAFSSGGYTGDSRGLAWLDEKELILKDFDTANILKAVDITRNIMSNLKTIDFNKIKLSNNSNPIQQEVIIQASFPSATNVNEIEKAFNNLSLRGLQVATGRV